MRLDKGFCQAAITLLLLFLLVTPGCATPMKPAIDGGISRLGFSIQVGAFAEVRNAERLTTRLQSRGIEAFYFRKDNGVYVVRFGDYRSRDLARRGAEKLVAEKLVDSYFIASPDAVFKKSQRVTQPVEPLKNSTTPKRSSTGDMGSIAARTAERFVGIPYRWGGDNVVDGMDCSGFVRAVYNLCGINIPRTSGEQFRVGEKVDKSVLTDGDLVFFGSSADKINHVGIYVGGGRFVHAPRRGDEIKISTIDEKYFADRFIGAKRYF